MESKIGRIGLGIVAVAAAVVLLVVLSSSDDSGSGDDDGGDRGASVSKPPGEGNANEGQGDGGAPRTPMIIVRGGKPVGGVEELDFEAGGTVRFAVHSDAPDELHVHGYDVERDLPAGRTVQVEFPASIEGIFEAELHESGEQIAELRINP
ncbi:MAG TPA: hypothetical protein VFY04_02800 [Solirubrobacterales bacterium]|nr:hypothetical protein [Solirubrobacterales bacterium]